MKLFKTLFILIFLLTSCEKEVEIIYLEKLEFPGELEIHNKRETGWFTLMTNVSYGLHTIIIENELFRKGEVKNFKLSEGVYRINLLPYIYDENTTISSWSVPVYRDSLNVKILE